MTNKLNFSFRINVFENGDMHPYFSVSPPNVGKYLNYLSINNQNLESLKTDIEKIIDVIEGRELSVLISDKGDCIFNVKQSNTELIEFYEEFEQVSINTLDFLKLFKDWYDFLKKYYEGNIPFIIPMNLRTEYKIVKL
jgi:hypothetical protein